MVGRTALEGLLEIAICQRNEMKTNQSQAQGCSRIAKTITGSFSFLEEMETSKR
jgi:hypothetical protein